MAMRDLDRRLEKLEAANDPGNDALSLTAQMEAAFRRSKARSRAWDAAGNEGHPPHGPLYELAPTATRAEREMWRKLAEGRARGLHMGHETDGTSPFNSLADAYAMSDDELLAAINSHPSAAVWPPDEGAPA